MDSKPASSTSPPTTANCPDSPDSAVTMEKPPEARIKASVHGKTHTYRIVSAKSPLPAELKTVRTVQLQQGLAYFEADGLVLAANWQEPAKTYPLSGPVVKKVQTMVDRDFKSRSPYTYVGAVRPTGGVPYQYSKEGTLIAFKAPARKPPERYVSRPAG